MPLDLITHFKSEMPAIIIGTLSLIAGLALNDAVSTAIDEYYPKYDKSRKNSRYKLIYAAFLITIFAVLVCIILRMDP